MDGRFNRHQRKVLHYLLDHLEADGVGWCYVIPMMREIKVGAGSIYVVLARFERDGLAISGLETPEPEDRPRRRCYRVNPTYANWIRQRLALLEEAEPATGRWRWLRFLW